MQQTKPQFNEYSESISVAKMKEAHSKDIRFTSQLKNITESQMKQIHSVGGYIPNGYTVV
tara:strand:- start:3267 stop:3446 length:180 start_codon:yes stop_codon:yes gene_type:complete